MKSNKNQRYIKLIVVIFTIISAIIYFVGFVLIPKAMAQGTLDLVLFYRTRFEILGQSPKGDHYTKLFDTYAREITEIIMNDSSLTWKSIDVLVRWQSNLDDLVNGNGNNAIISEDDVTSIKNYLDIIAQHASPELKSIIDEELSATPLKSTIGMTMNQAWVYLNDDPRFQSQALKSQDFPYPKQDSANTIAGVFSNNSNFAIDFNKETWILSSWNNGITDSWIAKNLNLSDCALTVPRSISDPYDTLDISYKTLGDVKYKVQTADVMNINKEVITLYILYQPVEIAGQPFQGDYPPFILYTGISNVAQCIEQGEVALASLHLILADY